MLAFIFGQIPLQVVKKYSATYTLLSTLSLFITFPFWLVKLNSGILLLITASFEVENLKSFKEKNKNPVIKTAKKII